ncbi:MAG: HAMP domain-containing sensor histidine kinase [Bryobacteraceae bacterium]
MKPRISLTGKILLCVLLNSLLLCISTYAVVRLEMNAGVESNVLAPTYARLRLLAEGLSRELQEQPASEASRIVAATERRTGLSLGVYRETGAKLAGSATMLPEPVLRELGHGIPASELARDSESAEHQDAPLREPADQTQPAGAAVPSVFLIRAGEPELFWFGVHVPVGTRGSEPRPGTLIISSPFLFTNPALFDLRPWITGLLIMTVSTLLCWVPLILYLSRSFREVMKGAERLAEGRFDSKLEAGGQGDEIAQLSAALNRVSGQLEGFVAGQKRFLGDIAHELTAPIARTHAAVGVLEQRSTRGTLPYVERVGEEIEQMSALVNELLQFSRDGLRPDPAPPVPQRVGEVVETITRRESAESRVVMAVGGDLMVLAQPNGLSRALSNLVRNALRYAGDAGPVTISARRRGDLVEIVVADEGPGIPEDLLERVLTPFYRLESSRSRRTGGTGLGLAIVKACVEASGGTVVCRNRVPRGLEVAVTLQAA